MKFVINSLEDVAESLRGEYEAHSGKFRLKVEGDIPALLEANAKIVEFRNNNIELNKEVTRLKPIAEKFEGIDADEARTAIEKVKALGKKGVNDPQDFDTKLSSAVDAALKPLREQLTTMTSEVQSERQRANDFLLRSQVADAFTKVGGKANASDFVVNLAKDIFEVKDNSVVAKTGKFSTAKPGDPISIDEWLESVQQNHDYVFAPSSGGGAPRDKKGANGGSGGPQPKLKEGQTLLKNPTPQELGEHSAAIAAGKVKIVYETASA